MSLLRPRMIPAVQGTNRPSRGQEGRFRPRYRLVIPPFHSPVLGYGLVSDQAHSKGPFRPSAVALLRSRIPKIGTAPSAFGPAGPRALGSHLASSSGPIHGTPHARSRAPRVSSALLPAAASRCAHAAVQGPEGLTGSEFWPRRGADQLRARGCGSRCPRSHRPSDTTRNATPLDYAAPPNRRFLPCYLKPPKRNSAVWRSREDALTAPLCHEAQPSTIRGERSSP